MKILCNKCKCKKDENEFYFLNKKKNIRQPACKKCCRTHYAKNHYLSNKNSYKERSKKSADKNKEWFKEYKSKLFCKICGENHPGCLDFHHRDPSTKEGEVGNLLSNKGRLATIKEIEKCDVLCANCHRKLHYS